MFRAPATVAAAGQQQQQQPQQQYTAQGQLVAEAFVQEPAQPPSEREGWQQQGGGRDSGAPEVFCPAERARRPACDKDCQRFRGAGYESCDATAGGAALSFAERLACRQCRSGCCS